MVEPLIAQAQRIEQALNEAARELAETHVEGRSEDNKVKVRLTGTFELARVRITAGALEETTPKQLEKAVAAAFDDALLQARALASARRMQALQGEEE
jgi:DNA-binding protein YbaB